jgi:hypothetical protein
MAQICTDSKQVTFTSILSALHLIAIQREAEASAAGPKIICGNLCNLWI